MFTIGKTYQIVLNTDLDGNTLPFPHTMVGTCLSFDKEYATFLDPMTNIVRGMKIQQGDPKLKESACKKSTTPSVSKPTAPSVSKPTAPSVSKPTAPSVTNSLLKMAAPIKKTEPVPDEPKMDDPNRYEKAKVEPVNAKEIPPDNQRILKKFKDYLVSKADTFPPDLTSDLEVIQKKNLSRQNSIYSFTGGLGKNPIITGPKHVSFIQSKYDKVDQTCFFLFNTKQLVQEGIGLLFLVALPKSECDQYTQTKKILFQSTDTKPVE